MSNIPYPSDFDYDYHADLHEERRRRALKSLDPGDVIAGVEATLAAEPDPTQHPLYHAVCHFLEHGTHTGAHYWAQELLVTAWETRIQDAIERLVDEVMARGED